MELLRFTGEVISIGDMPEEEVARMVFRPHLMLRLEDGRDVVLVGLTRDECKACLPAFLEAAQFTVSSA